MRKILRIVFSMSFAGIYMLLFAIAIGVATFIENDYGTPAAQKLVFHARWFEGLLLLFGVTLLINILKMKLIQRRDYAVFLFHIAMLIILLGAAITRYWGEEGMLPIREGQSNNQLISSETFLSGTISYHGQKMKWEDRVLFAGVGSNEYDRQFHIGDKVLRVRLDSFYPNAIRRVVRTDSGQGRPILTAITAGSMGRVQHLISPGDSILLGDSSLVFNIGQISRRNVIFIDRDTLWIRISDTSTVMTMATQQIDSLLPDSTYPLRMRSLYQLGGKAVVFKEYEPNGEIVPISSSLKMTESRSDALRLILRSGQDRKVVYLWGTLGVLPQKNIFEWEGMKIDLGYGSTQIPLPFDVHLKDFQLERYPGSKSPSSYASEVEVVDEEKNTRFDYRIYMNHVLDYRGYRLFQSSFDPDEKGTVLSVNKDRWGTNITYLGYFLLALGMLLSLFSKKSRFHKVIRNIRHLQERRRSLTMVLLVVISGLGSIRAQFPDSIRPIPRSHAAILGQVLVQGPKGRVEPLNTLSSQIVRKVTGKNSLYGQNSDQILAGMIGWPEVWQRLPIIKIGHPEIGIILGIAKGENASFADFYEADGTYKLKGNIETALEKRVAERSLMDKEVLKADERFNVLYMAFSGEMLKIFPKADDPNQKWYNPLEAVQMDFGDANVLTQHFIPYYIDRMHVAMKSGDWEEPDFALKGLLNYQDKAGYKVVPTKTKRHIEIAYNKINIFGWLILGYFIVGLLLLLLTFFDLFKPGRIPVWVFRGLAGMVVLAFISHTIGLGVRWYLSGHAPWSNGYESMIYIGWAIVLAGLIFIKKSPVTIAATALLAGIVLGVAGMNWLNPEITPLVPVLKSYWLSIHVSIIVASYGFFALGAILGLINLMLYVLRTKGHEEPVTLTIKELSNIAEATLTIGVILLSIGTFLGGVWANESWGRYWGWDSKETWALVSILIYAFVLHMRMIPGLKDMYSFNLASVLAFFSILMTYFGVNYYLSGLHSYAAGDPVPIPVWVYYAIGIIAVIGTLAYFKASPKERHG